VKKYDFQQIQNKDYIPTMCSPHCYNADHTHAIWSLDLDFYVNLSSHNTAKDLTETFRNMYVQNTKTNSMLLT